MVEQNPNGTILFKVFARWVKDTYTSAFLQGSIYPTQFSNPDAVNHNLGLSIDADRKYLGEVGDDHVKYSNPLR